jgi:hypothetical protein
MLQCDLQISLCTVYHTVLQYNICDMHFTVQFTLYGTAVMQCRNIIALERKDAQVSFLSRKESLLTCQRYGGAMLAILEELSVTNKVTNIKTNIYSQSCSLCYVICYITASVCTVTGATVFYLLQREQAGRYFE